MNTELMDMLRPMPQPSKEFSVSFKYLDSWLDQEREISRTKGGVFDLNPDFQRGHVWTDDQASHYVLNAIRGMAPTTIMFNSPNYDGRRGKQPGDMHDFDFVCIDGLQRLTAVRRFMSDQLPLPSGHFLKDLGKASGILSRIHLRFNVQIFVFSLKKDLIQFYLDLNTGGTPHTTEEIQRVRAMLETV